MYSCVPVLPWVSEQQYIGCAIWCVRACNTSISTSSLARTAAASAATSVAALAWATAAVALASCATAVASAAVALALNSDANAICKANNPHRYAHRHVQAQEST